MFILTPNEEAIKYFKGKAGFSRLFSEFASKVESIGTTGGNVKLNNLTDVEKVVLRNWFQKDFSTLKSATVSLKNFEKKFKDTRFEGANLYEVIEGVIGKKLVYKKDELQESERKKEEFFLTLQEKYPNEVTHIVTQYILSKKSIALGFLSSYNKGDLLEIEIIYKALSYLPLEKPLRLPVFAEVVVGDPHAFDNEVKMLSALQMVREVKYNVPPNSSLNAEFINQLLFDFGILKDDLTNFVTLYGLRAEKNGKVLRSWIESFNEGSVRNEPLREIAKLDVVKPVSNHSNKVFVVENSGVFSSILDELEGLPISLICTHGQFKLAALQIIKLLTKANYEIYYSGDTDPEGLQMAYSLKQRFPNHVFYWRFTPEDYMSSLSSVNLEASRLKKLDSVKDVSLEPLINKIKNEKKAAYQERQLEYLIEDIKQEYRHL